MNSNEIVKKIDFEEKWLINVKMDNGFIAISDIQMAMSAIRYVVSKLNEKKECEYYDTEAGTCRRSEV